MTAFASAAAVDSVMSLVNREVWIVTAADSARRGGMAATWVSQASLDSAQAVMVLGAAPNHFTTELIDASGAFGLHLVTGEQADLALNFAIGSGRDRDKLDGVEYASGATGAPLLSDCLGWLDCRVFARLETGDRNYYWAEVADAKRLGDGLALREQELIACANPAQKQQLRENREFDIRVQQPDWRAWRNNLPESLRPRLG